jgi:hypothetical protein
MRVASIALVCVIVLLCGCRADVPSRSPDAPAPAVAAAAGTTRPALEPGRGTPPSPSLHALAPSADPAVLALALRARQCAMQSGAVAADASLGVIDYSLPSTRERLWVFAMGQHPRLLFHEYVAHGRGSGDNFATRFSNDDGSLQSSLGLFRTGETYVGGNGYSLRLDGLEPGINDHARPRLLVMHGAWYVDPLLALKQGRLGRSYGCPALRPETAHAVIDSLKQGQLLFAYYPDRRWLSSSPYLRCGGNNTADEPETRIHAASR